MPEEIPTQPEETKTVTEVVSEIEKSPEVQVPVKSKPWLKPLLFSILGIILAAGLVFAGYKLGQKKFTVEFLGPQLAPTPTPVVVATPTPDPTANWKTYRSEKYGFGVKYPEEWNVREIRASVIFNYGKGCYFFIDIIPKAHGDYDELSTLRERGDKEENIIVGDINGVYFDSINVCSPPICPETLVRTIYVYKEDNLYRIARHATKDTQETECIDTFNRMLSTFRFLE